MRENKRKTGSLYEQQAAELLIQHGYRIVERNYTCRFGEIDLIARQGGYLVFVEVKYRRDSRCGTPQEAVNYQKQKKIIRAAQYYCLQHQLSGSAALRFDVVAILDDQTEIIENAFEQR